MRDDTSGTSSLTLRNLNDDDNAQYACRANNDYSAIVSNMAGIHVKGMMSQICHPWHILHSHGEQLFCIFHAGLK